MRLQRLCAWYFALHSMNFIRRFCVIVLFLCSSIYSYANSEGYRRALEDFDAALKINPSHVNARKYACDTLLALGRRWFVIALSHYTALH
jgi:tetratricopeptide (TPR) repeat protein